jgi:ribosomal protein L33
MGNSQLAHHDSKNRNYFKEINKKDMDPVQ